MARGKGKTTIENYVGNMKDPRFTFSSKCTWNKVHGDGKSTTYGHFVAYTQASTTEPTVYLVKVTSGKKLFLAPITIEAQPDNSPPLDADVLLALREAIGLNEK